MGRVAAVAVLLGVLALPASAGAVTASVSGNTLTLNGGPEDNGVEIGQTGSGSVKVTDTAGVTMGNGCQPDGQRTSCGDFSTTALVVNLGDGSNSLHLMSDTIFSNWDALTSILVNGGAGPDDIGPDKLEGAPWTVNAGGGNDTVQGSDEDDHLNGGPGEDDINGYPGNDTIHGGPGNDTLFGNSDSDKLYGEAGDDDLNGSTGSDLVDGGPGKDTMQGDDDSDTMNAVDGEQDVVHCGFGTDVANVDSIDAVGNEFDCEQQNVHKPKPGPSTPAPKPQPFKKHCKTKHGKRTCKQPRALKRKTYKGTTSQGANVTTGLDKNGKYFVFRLQQLTFKCQDGKSFYEYPVDVVSSDKQKVAKNGTASTEIDYDPTDVTNEVIFVVAAFDGKKARGVVVGNGNYAGHGSCTSGKVPWTAKVP